MPLNQYNDTRSQCYPCRKLQCAENPDYFVPSFITKVRIFGSKSNGPCRKVSPTFRKMSGFLAHCCSSERQKMTNTKFDSFDRNKGNM